MKLLFKHYSVLFCILTANIIMPMGTASRAIALVGSSIGSAYSMVKEGYTRMINKKNRDYLLSFPDDTDSTVQTFIREQLRIKGYQCADTIAIKTIVKDGTIAAALDNCLVLSKTYETDLKRIIESTTTNDYDTYTLQNFMVTLDHEMFHIQDEHEKKSIRMKFAIPAITELVGIPLLYMLLKNSRNSIFYSALGAACASKYYINRHLQNVYTQSQERQADRWAIQHCNNSEELDAFYHHHHKSIIRQGILGLCLQEVNNKTTSLAFAMLIKLFRNEDLYFNAQRFDTDEEYAVSCIEKIKAFYKKLKQQPYQWPLRLLQYSIDPEHPFVLDDKAVIQKRMHELQQSQLLHENQ